jgi:hypothetical protein
MVGEVFLKPFAAPSDVDQPSVEMVVVDATN